MDTINRKSIFEEEPEKQIEYAFDGGIEKLVAEIEKFFLNHDCVCVFINGSGVNVGKTYVLKKIMEIMNKDNFSDGKMLLKQNGSDNFSPPDKKIIMDSLRADQKIIEEKIVFARKYHYQKIVLVFQNDCYQQSFANQAKEKFFKQRIKEKVGKLTAEVIKNIDQTDYVREIPVLFLAIYREDKKFENEYPVADILIKNELAKDK